MKKKGRFGILQKILLMADVVLLAWICVSFVQQHKKAEPDTEPATQSGYISTSDHYTDSYETQQPSAQPTDAPETEPPEDAQSATQAQEIRTGDRPLMSDFDWFTGSRVNSVPADAERITMLPDITGRWMAYIFYDPENTTGFSEKQLLNAEIEIGQFGVILRFDHYIAVSVADGSVRNDEENGDSEMLAEWSDGALTAAGSGEIRITDFYKLNGKLYAIGTMLSYDDTPSLIAMVRE